MGKNKWEEEEDKRERDRMRLMWQEYVKEVMPTFEEKLEEWRDITDRSAEEVARKTIQKMSGSPDFIDKYWMPLLETLQEQAGEWLKGVWEPEYASRFTKWLEASVNARIESTLRKSNEALEQRLLAIEKKMLDISYMAE